MAPSGQMTASALQSMLKDATLAGSWTLDASRSTIGLRSKSMWGLAPVKGVFRQVSGNGSVSPAGEVSGAITAAAASVDTKNKKRDTHLRSADFFDSDTYPQITFRVDRLTPSSQGVTVAGALTVRDRTRPVSFDARASVVDGEVWLDAELQVDRSDFGLALKQIGKGSKQNPIPLPRVFNKDWKTRDVRQGLAL